MEFKELEERIDLIKEKLNSDTVFPQALSAAMILKSMFP